MMPPNPETTAAIRSPLLRVAPRPEPQPASLLEALLREQQSLTAVERFSRAHDSCGTGEARHYRDLIPLERPRAGQQYAFEVDLDACTGCKACVAACHNLNGLDEAETWRSVGLLHGGSAGTATQQTVTTSCHHCVEPACMAGCPVQAYEKDPVTGIVRHLDDQCIGCQYCTLTCPYDAPKYSPAKGIVRKCDMCSDRLAGGEAPACVQGCPNQAIRIRVVDQIEALQASDAGLFLPGAPAPDHTIPTTSYRTRHAVPGNLLPADFYSISPEHSHPPLVILLVVTQLAVGAFTFGSLVRALFTLPTAGAWGFAHAAIALGLGLLALGASVFHLGRPRYAYRALLGLRTSWLSREGLAFALFAKFGALYALSLVPSFLPAFPGRDLVVALRPAWELAACVAGLGGVFCSILVYAVTRRAHWRAAITGPKFAGTTAILGAAAVHAISQGGAALAGTAAPVAVPQLLLVTILSLTALKLAGEALILRHHRDRQHSVLKRMAILMVRDLGRVTLARFACGAVGGLLIPALILKAGAAGEARPVAAVAAFLLLLAGELLERSLFFRAAPPSRMPGPLA